MQVLAGAPRDDRTRELPAAIAGRRAGVVT